MNNKIRNYILIILSIAILSSIFFLAQDVEPDIQRISKEIDIKNKLK